MEEKIKIETTTPEEAIKNFAKELKDLKESGVEFSTITVDSYDNIKKESE